MVWRYTSPMLDSMGPDAAVLRECPVGLILREGPHVYDAIAAHAYAENGALNPLDSPPYLQSAIRVVASERARLRELADADRQTKKDQAYLGKALRRG
jgi:hypothetical protein